MSSQGLLSSVRRAPCAWSSGDWLGADFRTRSLCQGRRTSERGQPLVRAASIWLRTTGSPARTKHVYPGRNVDQDQRLRSAQAACGLKLCRRHQVGACARVSCHLRRACSAIEIHDSGDHGLAVGLGVREPNDVFKLAVGNIDNRFHDRKPAWPGWRISFRNARLRSPSDISAWPTICVSCPRFARNEPEVSKTVE